MYTYEFRGWGRGRKRGTNSGVELPPEGVTSQAQIRDRSQQEAVDMKEIFFFPPCGLRALGAGSEGDGEALRRVSSWKVPSERDGL